MQFEPNADSWQLLERARSARKQGRLGNALRSCDTTLKRPPDWAEAYNLCGLILYDIGHTEEAIAAYAEAVCLDPSFGDARRNLLRAGDSLMVYAFILLIRIPLPIKKDRWSCRECGASW